jgi:hypothetical protein
VGYSFSDHPDTPIQGCGDICQRRLYQEGFRLLFF